MATAPMDPTCVPVWLTGAGSQLNARLALRLFRENTPGSEGQRHPGVGRRALRIGRSPAARTDVQMQTHGPHQPRRGRAGRGLGRSLSLSIQAAHPAQGPQPVSRGRPQVPCGPDHDGWVGGARQGPKGVFPGDTRGDSGRLQLLVPMLSCLAPSCGLEACRWAVAGPKDWEAAGRWDPPHRPWWRPPVPWQP